ncbi:MAG: hypothetical protein ACI9NT_001456 [Bacteroidia bacterium]|jgi:hypothetical protein
MRTNLRCLVSLFLMLLLVAGCSGRATISQAVRSGDTVLVALDSSRPNGLYGFEGRVTAEMLREEDILATVRDSNLIEHTAKVRRLFRVYADPTAVSTATAGEGEWMMLVDLVDAEGIPLQMGTGMASIVLSSVHLSSDVEMELEILPGTGSPHAANIREGYPIIDPLQDYSAQLIPSPQASVGITGSLLPGEKLIAAEYVFEFPDIPVNENTLLGPVELQPGIPVKLPFNNNGVYFDYTSELLGGQTGTRVIVMLSAPRGFARTGGFRNFHFVMTSEQSAINAQTDYWQAHLVSSVFYDEQGEELGALSANVGSIR